MKLVTPTKSSIRRFYNKYYQNSPTGFKDNYQAIFKLIQIYPSHNKLSHVLLKAVVINELYSTNILAIRKIAIHISQLNIGTSIKKGSRGVVKAISTEHGIKSKKKNKEFDFYSFATKYCYSHNPSKYSIYDRNVEEILWAYKKRDNFFDFKRKKLRDYEIFSQTLAQFRKHYHLAKSLPTYLTNFFGSRALYFLMQKIKLVNMILKFNFGHINKKPNLLCLQP
jgi:hypothetical protein